MSELNLKTNLKELLNTFFASLFTTENTNNLPYINNIFLDGFVRNKSCLTNLLVFVEEVANYLDSGYPVDVKYRFPKSI